MIGKTQEEFIFYTNKADTIDDLFLIYEKKMADIGFNRVLFGLVNDHPTLKKEAEIGIFRNYPNSWMKHYQEQDYEKIDPVIDWIKKGKDIFTWDEINNTKSFSKKQKKILNEARDAELFQGVGFTLHGHGAALAGIGAASTERNIDLHPIILNYARLLSIQFYTCFWALMRKESNLATITLSLREQEVLKWIAKGYTQNDIAERLNLSSHTVDGYIRVIKNKLDTKNITATVILAIKMGLINI